MPRRERRQSETVPETFFSVLICCILPMGILGVLIAATVQNFDLQAEQGWCHITQDTADRAFCQEKRPTSSYFDAQYVAVLPDILFSRSHNDTDLAEVCSLQRPHETAFLCSNDIHSLTPGSAVPCYLSLEESWWLDRDDSDRCLFEEPQPVDAFDKVLPIVCAVVLVLAVSSYWALRLKKHLARRRRFQEVGTESEPLVERASLPRVARHVVVEDGAVTLSAEWMSASDAAIIVGDASKGSFPCEVQKVYDVGATLQPECTVCLENEKTVVMWPCRHLCVCPDCAVKLRKCPVCRCRVKKRLCLELRQLEQADPAEGGDGGVPHSASESESDSGSDTPHEPIPTRRATVRLSIMPIPPAAMEEV